MIRLSRLRHALVLALLTSTLVAAASLFLAYSADTPTATDTVRPSRADR